MSDGGRRRGGHYASDAPRAAEPWNIPDGMTDDSGDAAGPLATLVSFHYLRAAVRRRWHGCVAAALIGMLLAAGYLAMKPAVHTASTTVRLVHDQGADPSGAIATDISLVATRTVAARTIDALGLHKSPDAMMNSVAAVPTGSTQVLQLTMTAPTDAQAVRWLAVFTQQYLKFRAAQISAQNDVVLRGDEQQIDQLQAQAALLRKTVEDPTVAKHDPGQLTEDVSKLSAINDKISTLQSAVDDQQLQQQSIVSASGVIDPAAATTTGRLKRDALVLISGLIAGLAIGFLVTVLRAIVSDRLWLRIEVRAALSAVVLTSARRIAPRPRLSRFARWVPRVRAEEVRRAEGRQRVARTLDKAVPISGRRPCLAVACLDNSDEMRFAVAAAALTFEERGRPTTIVDLTASGSMSSVIARGTRDSAARAPAVFRPSAVPSLAESPSRVAAAGSDETALPQRKNQVVLVVAEFDPGIGIDFLTGWADDVVVGVTAGRSSAELVRTAGDLIRAAGLNLRGAVLLGAVRDDTSSGVEAVPQEAGSNASRRPAPSRAESSSGGPS